MISKVMMTVAAVLFLQLLTAQTSPQLPPLEDTDYIYRKVEVMPTFPTCDNETYTERDRSKCTDAKLTEFIREHLVYPKLAYDNHREGMCVVTFNVRKNGMLGEIQMSRDIGLGCGKEAVNIFHKMNEMGIRWNPGYENGEPVVVRRTVPVTFVHPSRFKATTGR